jgi:hypothetical protein
MTMSAVADLTIIRKRAHDGLYRSLEHYQADLRSLFGNCRLYNKPDTEYVAYVTLGRTALMPHCAASRCHRPQHQHRHTAMAATTMPCCHVVSALRLPPP